MRIAVLGTGRLGSFRARILSGLSEVDEVILGNRTLERAEEVAEEIGGTAGTIDEAIDTRPDAVFVSLATELHAGVLHRCIDAGLPIFCEKPIALNLSETAEVIEHANEAGSLGFDRYAKYDDVDNAAILMNMSDGLPVIITGTRHNPRGHDFRMEVFGSEDSLSVGQDSLSQPRPVEPDAPSPDKGPYGDFMERFGECLRQETMAFIEVMKGERENPSPPDTAMEALRVAVACEVSRKEGRPVRVADIEDEPSGSS